MDGVTPKKQALGEIETDVLNCYCTEPGALFKQDGILQVASGSHGQAASLNLSRPLVLYVKQASIVLDSSKYSIKTAGPELERHKCVMFRPIQSARVPGIEISVLDVPCLCFI